MRAWQIWNEPDIKTYWAPKPNLRAYVALLRVSYPAIKRADRHATVVAAGLPFPGTAEETSYLTKLYRAGARRLFDALALHPYAATAAGAFARLQAARMALVRRARPQLRLRELIHYGWRDDVYGPGPNWWGYHLGLFTQSLQPKPALSTFASAARRLDR